MRYKNPSLGPLPKKLENLIVSLNARFVADRIEFAVVGGVAYSSYMRPRQTTDIDIVVFVPTSGYAVRILRDMGFRQSGIGTVIPSLKDARSVKYYNDTTDVDIDIFISGHRFFREAIKRSNREDMYGIPMIPIEALIVMKKVSYRDRLSSKDVHEKDEGLKDFTDYEKLIHSAKFDIDLLLMFAGWLGVYEDIRDDLKHGGASDVEYVP